MRTIKHKNGVICLFGLVLVLIWDTLFRLWVPSNLVGTNVEYRDIVSSNASAVNAQAAEAILASFAGYDKPEGVTAPAVKVPSGMSEQQQRQQSGSLSRLFDGDYEYRLSGVFWDSSYFAILSKTHMITKETEEIKLRSHDLLGDYRVQAISQFKIDFTREAQQLSLPMFLAIKPSVN
jgi:hypothetical protein